jgi:hypothetical protein
VFATFFPALRVFAILSDDPEWPGGIVRLTDWRNRIESVIAENAGKPCPKCNKVHDRRQRATADVGDAAATRTSPGPAEGAEQVEP